MARKPHKYHYIYKTTCKITGRYYIGMHSTSNLEDEYIGSGKRLWYSIRKHGRENHEREILEFLPDRNSLANREKELVNEDVLIDSMCMNIRSGGKGGWSEKDRKKGTQTMLEKMWKDPEYLARKKEQVKKMHTFEARLKASETMIKKTGSANGKKGTKQTEEWKKMISENNKIAQKGERNSQYNTSWIFKDGECKKIKKSELDLYLTKGWKKGRK